MNGAAPGQVLAVVHDQQQLLGGQEALDRLARATRPRAAMIAERADDRRGHVLAAVATAASDTKRAPSAKSASTARAASSASRVLPTPPGPVSVSSRTEPARSRSPTAASSSPATDRPIRRRRQRAAPDRRLAPAARAAASSAGSWREDRLVEVVQLGARLDPELLDEHLAGVAVGLQRVGLAAAAIQREHQLRVQPLAPRMLARELLELGDQLGVAPGGEVGLHAHLQRRQALLLQARDLGRRERRRRELRQRRPTPQRQRLAQHAPRPARRARRPAPRGPSATPRSKRSASSSPTPTSSR